MRSKEQAHDYRYFPEPDLLPLVVDKKHQAEVRRTLPELPEARRQRMMRIRDLGAGCGGPRGDKMIRGSVRSGGQSGEKS